MTTTTTSIKTKEEKLNTYLGQKGYTLHKSELSVDQQTFIRRELTVRPFMPGSPAKLPEFPVYRESKSKLYVPRYFGIDHFGKPGESKLPDPISIDITFGSELRDYQKDIVNTFLSFKSEGGGLLDIPCGRGKTVMALNILAQIGLKTLVIVHKEFLLNQWVERIEQNMVTVTEASIRDAFQKCFPDLAEQNISTSDMRRMSKCLSLAGWLRSGKFNSGSRRNQVRFINPSPVLEQSETNYEF